MADFALMPALAQADAIDYLMHQGQELYCTNTCSLYMDETLFSAEAAALDGFLSTLKCCSREVSWGAAWEVPIDLNWPDDKTHSMLMHYGEFNLEHLVTFSETYANEENCHAQDNFQICMAIMALLLSADATVKITPWATQYMVGDQLASLPLLKVIIHESHIDTNVTMCIICEDLSLLNKHLILQGYDVDKLNTFVQNKLKQLCTHGATTTDLLPYLFKGYKVVKDENFIKYIKDKEDKYDEGLDLMPETLMVHTSNKYKTLVQAGMYNKPSKDQEKILALKAKLQKVEKDFKKTTDSSKTALQKSGGCISGTNTQGNNSTGKKAKPAWMLKKPSDEDVCNNKVKMVNGKEYFWCTHHKCYGCHKTAQCEKKGITLMALQNANASNASNNNNNTNGQLHLSSALSAITQE